MASRQYSVKQAVGNKFLTGQVNFRIFLDFFSVGVPPKAH